MNHQTISVLHEGNEFAILCFHSRRHFGTFTRRQGVYISGGEHFYVFSFSNKNASVLEFWCKCDVESQQFENKFRRKHFHVSTALLMAHDHSLYKFANFTVCTSLLTSRLEGKWPLVKNRDTYLCSNAGI